MLGPVKPRRLDQPITVSLEDLVPRDHFYRHFEATLDLGFVRDWTRELYAERGRPSIDPVVFFKLQLVMFCEGIRSERKLIETASLNLAHRWYLGYALDEALPDHSSLTRIRQRLRCHRREWRYVRVVGISEGIAGVYGRGDTADSHGVEGISNGPAGVYGRSDLPARGDADAGGVKEPGAGVVGESTVGGDGVRGRSSNGVGVFGSSDTHPGVYGASQSGIGVKAFSASTYGVVGESRQSSGVLGSSESGIDVAGHGPNVGVYAHNSSLPAPSNDAYLASNCCAGDFNGNVSIHGNLTKASGAFQIDHLLDPANKYLNHSFVESPDMKNVYDGIAITDDRGKATIGLPVWFEVLNKDFRYQLTPIGAPSPNLHIAAELADSRFEIAGGLPAIKVAWQVTGIRQDAWANAHRIQVEEQKPAKECGYYLHPELHGERDDRQVQWARYPELTRRIGASNGTT